MGTILVVMLYLAVAVVTYRFCLTIKFDPIQAFIIAASWPGAAIGLCVGIYLASVFGPASR